ncbi:MAG: hypothetical protein KJO31_05995 [Gammaproteobacteria bacterium]|nr:hypothetical protein [Gammaproteobacteria bacterium]
MLSPMRFLVGSCWQGTFPDGESVDTHCYRSFYGNAFIRDVHLVRGKNPDYRGETVYQWDRNANSISYRYWNSLGGVSDGVAHSSDGMLFFPGERHVRDDGTVVVMQTVIEQTAPDKYVSTTEQQVDSEWKELWRIEFSRLSPSTDLGPAGRQQAEKLAVFSRLIGNWADPEELEEAQKSGTAVPIQQSYQWGPRRMLLRVYENLAQSFTRDALDPVLEGMVVWDHAVEGYRYMASTRYGWTFDGQFRALDDGRIERSYEVHYAKGEQYIPEPDLGGQVRRFREIYNFDGNDRVRISLELWKDDKWSEFGPGHYDAVRVDH